MKKASGMKITALIIGSLSSIAMIVMSVMVVINRINLLKEISDILEINNVAGSEKTVKLLDQLAFYSMSLLTLLGVTYLMLFLSSFK